jgi:hypothetical protein
VNVKVKESDGSIVGSRATVRIDSSVEVEYYGSSAKPPVGLRPPQACVATVALRNVHTVLRELVKEA